MGLRTRANVQLPFASKGCPSTRLAEALANGERTAGGGRARSSRASAPPSTSSKPHHRGPIAPTPAPSGRAKTSSSQRWLLPVPFSLFLLESRGARLEPLSAFYRHAWEPGPNFKLHSFHRTWPLTRRQEDTPPGTTCPSQGWSPAEPALHGPQALVRFSMFSGHGPSPRCPLLRCSLCSPLSCSSATVVLRRRVFCFLAATVALFFCILAVAGPSPEVLVLLRRLPPSCGRPRVLVRRSPWLAEAGYSAASEHLASLQTRPPAPELVARTTCA